jgi:hypothetical protein
MLAAAEFNEETAPTMEAIPIAVPLVESFFSIWKPEYHCPKATHPETNNETQL